jgi:hypothetical protein
MQRSITDQKPIVPFLYIVLYVLYSSLASIYPFLPPLLSVLFVLFSRALQRDDTIALFLIAFCLVVFEANYGYLLFSSLIYFYIQYRFIMPKIIQNFSCNSCIKISYVFFTYLGYFAFLTFISNIFLLEAPEINYYIIYYIIIEFLIVSLL